MAVGDTNDMVFRVKANLPQSWFGDSSPILDAVVTGLASTLAFIYSLIQYAQNQTRIATATDGFLDLISFDYFGSALPRRQQEQDTPFRARIQAALLPQRATRAGMISALQTLTGRTPWIFEPTRPLDTGAYNTNIFGYGAAGGYGSMVLPAQAFIVAYRPSGSGIPNIAGYGVSTGAYNTASQSEWCSLSQIVGYVTDAQIFAAVAATQAEGVNCWTRLSN